MEILEGVILSDLKTHEDDRGTFTEIYRESWNNDFKTLQWNAVNSEQNVLRGVHLHKLHYDYLTVLVGEVFFGLHDMRMQSSTYKQSVEVIISAKKNQTLVIPPGVAHGFHFLKPSIHLYGVSEYWSLNDELGCLYDQEELAINWPHNSPMLSDRDQKLGTYQELLIAANDNKAKA